MFKYLFFLSYFSDLGLSVTPTPGPNGIAFGPSDAPPPPPGASPIAPVAPAAPVIPVTPGPTPVPSSTPLAPVPAVPEEIPAFEIRQPQDDFIEQGRSNPNPATPAPFVPLDPTPEPFEGTFFGQRLPNEVSSPSPFSFSTASPFSAFSPSPSPFSAFPTTPKPEGNLASIFSNLQSNQPAQPAPNLGPIDPLAGTTRPGTQGTTPNDPFGIFRSFSSNLKSDTALLPEKPLASVVSPASGAPGGFGVSVPAVPRPGAVEAVGGAVVNSIFDQKPGKSSASPAPFTQGAFGNNQKESEPLIRDDAPTLFTPTPRTSTTPEPFNFSPTPRPKTTGRGKLRGGRTQSFITATPKPKSQFDDEELSFSLNFANGNDQEDSLAVEKVSQTFSSKFHH